MLILFPKMSCKKSLVPIFNQLFLLLIDLDIVSILSPRLQMWDVYCAWHNVQKDPTIY